MRISDWSSDVCSSDLFSLDAMGVLTLPIRHAIEKRRFEQAKLKAANDILVIAAETRQAWYRAVAAQQAAVYVGQVKDAAEARVDQIGRASWRERGGPYV